MQTTKIISKQEIKDKYSYLYLSQLSHQIGHDKYELLGYTFCSNTINDSIGLIIKIVDKTKPDAQPEILVHESTWGVIIDFYLHVLLKIHPDAQLDFDFKFDVFSDDIEISYSATVE